MSESKRPKDALGLLWAIHRQLQREVKGEPGNPARMWFFRVLVLVVGLPVAGPVLWHALLHMPIGLWLLFGGCLTYRLVRWYLGRLP